MVGLAVGMVVFVYQQRDKIISLWVQSRTTSLNKNFLQKRKKEINAYTLQTTKEGFSKLCMTDTFFSVTKHPSSSA